jgi:hypothetical protein
VSSPWGARSLRWCDLDLDRGTLSVTTQRTTDSDYNIITKAPKGTGRQRYGRR